MTDALARRCPRELRAGLSLAAALATLALLALPAAAQALEQMLVAPDGAPNDQLGDQRHLRRRGDLG